MEKYLKNKIKEIKNEKVQMILNALDKIYIDCAIDILVNYILKLEENNER